MNGPIKIQLFHKFEDIISIENLLLAWQEFIRGKKKRPDVQEFSVRLLDNIISLHNDLSSKQYTHSDYIHFTVPDPKKRDIHKASVRDRLLHHAIYRILYPFFDRTFISDSYSCRLDKGTHKALDRFKTLGYKVSKNHTRTCWVLKCDIRKFFASIDQSILLNILKEHIPDDNIIWLLKEIITSFSSSSLGKGLPLGNLTSQLFVNTYMNKFDQFVKHKIKAKYYIRYADDFVLLSHDNKWLVEVLSKINDFLFKQLKLELHPNKVFIKTFASGVDFLGWVHFADHRILRNVAKYRMLRNLEENHNLLSIPSYLGLLSHGNTQTLIMTINRFLSKSKTELYKNFKF